MHLIVHVNRQRTLFRQSCNKGTSLILSFNVYDHVFGSKIEKALSQKVYTRYFYYTISENLWSISVTVIRESAQKIKSKMPVVLWRNHVRYENGNGQ
jgi:hypothetical protein